MCKPGSKLRCLERDPTELAAGQKRPVPSIEAMPMHVLPESEPPAGTWSLFLLAPPVEPLAEQPYFASLQNERLALRIRTTLTDSPQDDAFGEIDLFGDRRP